MSRMYPIFLKLDGKRCLVVGGGRVAARKIKTLLDAGARVECVSPNFSEEFSGIASKNLTTNKKIFEAGDLKGAALVIAATDDDAVNKKVFEWASERLLPVNVVDQPELCTFYVPSAVNRGDLQIAISTSGRSPALAKKIRKDLEDIFDERYAELLVKMGEARNDLMEKYPDDQKKRAEILNKLVEEEMEKWT